MCKCNPDNYNQQCHASDDCRWLGERMGKEYPPYQEEKVEMKLTSHIKKNSIGPILLLASFILWFTGMPFLVWYLTGWLGVVPTILSISKPMFAWFDRDGIR